MLDKRLFNPPRAVTAVFGLFLISSLQSCLGWSDMFAEKREIVGPYFLMTSDGGNFPQYFLFKSGQSGSITGAIKAIGWDRHFIIVQHDGAKRGWDIFPVSPELETVPPDDEHWQTLQRKLLQSIKLRSPVDVWNHAP